MGAHNNFTQSKEDERCCVDTDKSLCTQANWCIDTTLFYWL